MNLINVILVKNPDGIFEICTFIEYQGNKLINNSLHTFDSDDKARDWCNRLGYNIIETFEWRI